MIVALVGGASCGRLSVVVVVLGIEDVFSLVTEELSFELF